MHDILPIGLEALLHGAVESARLEFKKTWDAERTGPQVLKTLCGFANDLQNLNGGYILLGIAEDHGTAVRPALGLPPGDLEAAQKWIRGHCNRIEPTYMPILYPTRLDGQPVLVVWAPASDIRPHQAPDGPRGEMAYWVRIGSETLKARDSILTALIQQTARVPFDDRRAFQATNADLSLSLVREFLHEVRSDLRESNDAERVYRAMHLVHPVNAHTVPRNVGLLFFSAAPDTWFRGARIEVVEFRDDAGGNSFSESIFRGPLPHQVRQCLLHLEGRVAHRLQKEISTPESSVWANFPLAAIREAVVNAVYHRSYENSVEPTKIYLYPNRMEIISYPGPVPGIELRHLQGGEPVPPVPARNRRVGELLKELRLAEARGTGLPKIRRAMAENGSPPPTFDFDSERSYFRVTLPAHPR